MLTRDKLGNILALTIALLWFVNFDLIGKLYLSELMLLLVFLFMLKKHGKKLYAPIPKRIILFGILWFISQIVTDVIRETPIESLLKGWASIVFLVIDFSALFMLLSNNEKRLNMFIWGIAIGGILGTFFAPSEYYEEEFWKFGFGPSVILSTILAITWASKKKLLKPLAGELILILMGMVSIYLNARSLGGAAIITAALLFLARRRLSGVIFQKQLSAFRLIGILGVFLIVMFVILKSYQWAGNLGILPERAMKKYELSKTASFGALGVILAGRSEILASVPAVIDSPLIGHGSWASNPKYRQYFYDLESVLGVEQNIGRLRFLAESKDLIPAHSHLMQAWVWAGLLGAVFWLIVLVVIIRALFQVLVNYNMQSMITVYVCTRAGWALLFSPFGSGIRLEWGWSLVLMIMAVELTQKIRSRPDMDVEAG